MAKKIVIIGAGYAGVLTAKKLAKSFKKEPDVSITIIDKNPYHTMLTELHEVAANRVDEDSIKISLKKVFAGRKVDVKLDTVTSVDFEGKVVSGKSEAYPYDILVLASGSKPTYFGIPGAEQHSFKLWSFDDAVLLKDHIHNMFRKAAVTTELEEKKKWLSFYVVGAGFTGVEMAGELAEYAPFLCEKYEIDPELVNVTIVDMLSRTIPNLPEKLSVKVENRLRKMKVNVLLNKGVCMVGEDFIEVKEKEVCTRYTAGTVVWCAGIESSDVSFKIGETLQSAGRGRIATDEHMRSLTNEDVYVVGDNILFTAPGEERPVPQIVENCEHSAATVAKNIEKTIRGTGNLESYHPQFHGFMVCVGGRYGVARVGLPNMMFNLPSFLAMASKHLINIIYFLQVLGWNKIFSYIKHEFFTIRNKRSFLGGHFSNRTSSFLLVPVRVWLGGVWLFEGIKKVMEGWLDEPKLTGFFGGANAWYNSVLGITTDGASGATSSALPDWVANIAAATGAWVASAADATSAATGEAEYAAGDAAANVGTVILNWDIWGLLQIYFVSGKALIDSSLADLAFKINIPAMNWFLDSFVMPYDLVQIAMQAFIVFAEILIGLALIGGLFTTPAAAFSLILQMMFVTTTGLYLGTFWMIFAGIAVLVGAGGSLGLDYYVMPILKKDWKSIGFVRKWYLYHD